MTLNPIQTLNIVCDTKTDENKAQKNVCYGKKPRHRSCLCWEVRHICLSDSLFRRFELRFLSEWRHSRHANSKWKPLLSQSLAIIKSDSIYEPVLELTSKTKSSRLQRKWSLLSSRLFLFKSDVFVWVAMLFLCGFRRVTNNTIVNRRSDRLVKQVDFKNKELIIMLLYWRNFSCLECL